LHAEASQLVSEIDRIAANATFNGIKLLDGSYQDQNLQVGSGNESNDRIAISIASAKSSALGVGGGSSYSTVVNSTTAGVGSTALLSGALSINGFIVGGASTDGVSSTGSDSSGIAVAAAINAVSGQSGVTASVDKTVKAGVAVGLTAAGETGYSAVLASGAVSINGVSLGTIEAAASSIARGAQMTAAINSKSSQTGVIATFSTDNGAVSLSAADGRNIEIKIASATTAIASSMTGIAHTTGSTVSGASVTTVYRSSIKLSSSNASGITIGGITSAGLAASGLTATNATLAYTAATATAGAGVSTVDLTTATGSQTALSTLDKAINTITDARASMGAYQNRLAASISNLETSAMNLQASRSRILDTDYAKETTNLAKSQIIQQAATAMLAQANQSAQSVLALLK
jgi:flagellin